MAAVVMDRFNGNPERWVIQAELYFSFLGFPEKDWLSLPYHYLEGNALVWFDWLYRNKQFWDWNHFVEKLLLYCQNRPFTAKMGRLVALKAYIPNANQMFAEKSVTIGNPQIHDPTKITDGGNSTTTVYKVFDEIPHAAVVRPFQKSIPAVEVQEEVDLDKCQNSMPACSHQFVEARSCSDIVTSLADEVKSEEDAESNINSDLVDGISSSAANPEAPLERFEISIDNSSNPIPSSPLVLSIGCNGTIHNPPETEIVDEGTAQHHAVKVFDESPQQGQPSFLSALSHFRPSASEHPSSIVLSTISANRYYVLDVLSQGIEWGVVPFIAWMSLNLNLKKPGAFSSFLDHLLETNGPFRCGVIPLHVIAQHILIHFPFDPGSRLLLSYWHNVIANVVVVELYKSLDKTADLFCELRLLAGELRVDFSLATYGCLQNAVDAIKNTCALARARVVLWNISESLIFHLSLGGVDKFPISLHFNKVFNELYAHIDDTDIVFDSGGSTFDVSVLDGIVVGFLPILKTRQEFVKVIIKAFLNLTDKVMLSLLILHSRTLQLWNFDWCRKVKEVSNFVIVDVITEDDLCGLILENNLTQCCFAFPLDFVVLSRQLLKFSKGVLFGDSPMGYNIRNRALVDVSLAILILYTPCAQNRKNFTRDILQFYHDFRVHWENWFHTVHGLEAISFSTTLFLHIMIDIYMYVKSSWLESGLSLLDDQVYMFLFAMLESPVLEFGVLRCAGDMFDYWLGGESALCAHCIVVHNANILVATAIYLISEELTLIFENNMVVLGMLVFPDIYFGFVYEVGCRGGFRLCALPRISSVAMSIATCTLGVMLLGGLSVVRSKFEISTQIATCLWHLLSVLIIFLPKDIGCKWQVCIWISNNSAMILSVLLYLSTKNFHWHFKKRKFNVAEEELENLMMPAQVENAIAELSKPSSHGFFSSLPFLLSPSSNLEDKVLIEGGSIVMNKHWVPADYDATSDATEEMQNNFVWDTG